MLISMIPGVFIKIFEIQANSSTSEGQLMDLAASCARAEHAVSVCLDCSDTCPVLDRCGAVLCQ